MSLIIHRCTKCSVPSVYKDHKEGCGNGLFDGPPEVLVTRSNSTGEVVEALVKPGTKFNGFGHPAMDLCNCADCNSLFASLGGEAA